MVQLRTAKHKASWPMAGSATTRDRFKVERKVWGRLLEVHPDTQELKFTSANNKVVVKIDRFIVHKNLQYTWIW